MSSISVVLSPGGNAPVSMACNPGYYPLDPAQPDLLYALDSKTIVDVPLHSGYQQPGTLHHVYVCPQANDQAQKPGWPNTQHQHAFHFFDRQYPSSTTPATMENGVFDAPWQCSPPAKMEQDMTSPVGTASSEAAELDLSPQTPPTPDAALWHATGVAYHVNTQETPLPEDDVAACAMRPLALPLPRQNEAALASMAASAEMPGPLDYTTVLVERNLEYANEVAEPWQPIPTWEKHVEVQVSVHQEELHESEDSLSPESTSIAARQDASTAIMAVATTPAAPKTARRSRSLAQAHHDGNQSGKVVKRKAFEENKRQQTSRTRDIGACVRCRMQRVRCVSVTDDPDGPCRDCLRIAMSTSKKKIHHIECLRYKLQEVGLFRTCGLRFTSRWLGAEIRDITGFGPVMTIQIDQGSRTRLEIKVRQFAPDANVDNQDVFEQPYALASAHSTKVFYRSFIVNWKLNAYMNEMKRVPRDRDEAFISKVYKLAWRHYQRLCHEDSAPSQNLYSSSLHVKDISEKNYMEGVFELWFALRQATGTSNVLDSMAEREVPGLRAGGRTPKMAVCQLNSINIACVLRPLAKILLRVMTTWISDRQQQCWLSIFYSIFILMHQIAETTADAYYHGRKNADGRPNFGDCLGTIQESANIIQAYWHYFNCNVDVASLDEGARSKSPLQKLPYEEFGMLRDVWREGKEMALDRSFDNPWGHVWCHPLYFAVATFRSSWRPMRTFSE
ncbi:hypothetical protein BD289DRAFT_486867 [Coniella lustricola]|uniref:Zn(2)-C6 fungal-type domain-containing protein n=1 Tax=Coniella lustricola TaxID=2025994 RepID=A0A2T2ZTP9_9PEZI|nr:hypothetical protein BD289DRAFT_486867 [Coniella lustricola]